MRDRYIVLSGPRGSRSYRLSSVVQILFVLSLVASLLWLLLVLKGFVSRKNSVDFVYRQMSDLQVANEDLIEKIKSIDGDLSALSDYMAGKKASSASAQKWKSLGHESTARKAQMAVVALDSSVMNFTHAVNARVGFLLTAIQGLGVDPYRFISEKRAVLEKVRLSNIRVSSKSASVADVYSKRLRYYYYVPSYLVNHSDSSSIPGGIPSVSAKKVLGILKTLDSVLAALPVNPPMSGRFAVTSRYGSRRDPFTSGKKMHSGVDLVRYDGAEILAASGGVVAFAGFKGGYGYTVDINHGYGIQSRYAHMKGLAVSAGQRVKASQVVGYQGRTGSRCKGSHLHYEVHQDNKTINPLKYIYAKNSIRQDQVAYFSKQ